LLLRVIAESVRNISSKQIIDMGHWNYRVMKRKNDQGQFDFGIYEVFYDDQGEAETWTENSLIPTCESEADLKTELKIMMHAFEKEVLIYELGD
jgi:hypothetical protein